MMQSRWTKNTGGSMNTSNDLAEILRVSDEFAKVNQELRKDVDNLSPSLLSKLVTK